MCQIIFSPSAGLCSLDDFREANADNNDGIGVMSAMGVQKFFGKRQCKRAWSYVQNLAANNLAWAAHFRYGTAGLRDRSNVHPFTSAAGVHWMHNGVLRQSELYDRQNIKSDTAMLVELMLSDIEDPNDVQYLLEMAIGQGNKLLSYAPALDQWCIFNEQLGEWDDGIWFSNEYSRANWASKYGVPGASVYKGGSTTGYLYDGERHELTEMRADGSRGESYRAVDRGDGLCGISSTGKQVVVMKSEAQRDAERMERMALMQSTRSDSPLLERLADCVTCASLELKKCLCSKSASPPSELDIDMALEALDRRLIDDDMRPAGTVSLSDPRAIQERIDSYLAEEADQRAGADWEACDYTDLSGS